MELEKHNATIKHRIEWHFNEIYASLFYLHVARYINYVDKMSDRRNGKKSIRRYEFIHAPLTLTWKLCTR